MIRFLLLLLALDGLLFGAGLLVWTADRGSDRDQVYSAAALGAHLEHAGTAWAGRTIRVRGVVGNCGPQNGPTIYCLGPVLEDGAASLSVDPLPLALPRPSGLQRLQQLLTVLRGLVAPAPSALWEGETGVFRVHLQSQSDVYCGCAV